MKNNIRYKRFYPCQSSDPRSYLAHRRSLSRNYVGIFSLAILSFFLTASITGSLYAQDGSVITPAAYGSSSNVGGTVRNWTARKPETNPNNITTSSTVETFPMVTQYVDGMGRPVQTIVKQGSQPTGGSAYDLLSAQVYDAYGREVRQYLPFAGTATTGNFQTNPFQQQSSFYSGGSSPVAAQEQESYYYGKTEYETSPFARAQKTFAPGNSWVHDGRGIELQYWNNTTADSVRIWSVTDNSGTFGSYSSTRRYDPGTLYKFITIDERGNKVVEFKDKEGRTVLKKVQLTGNDTGSGSGHVGWLCTYYIYDAVSRLRAVVQPVGVELLMQNSWTMTALSNAILNEQTFRYEYDELGRLILKKVPGAGEVYMVYDARDRLVLMQDANMRQGTVKWLYTTYDALNRPLTTGLWNNASSRATHQSSAGSSTAYPNLSGQTYEQLSETHYDDYTNLPSGVSSSLNTTWITATNFITSGYNSSPDYVQQMVQSSRTLGLPTWTKTKVLGTSNTFLSTATIYDDKGQPIQVQSINQTGGLDVATMQYDFEGKEIRSHLRHRAVIASVNKDYEIGTKNTYDNLGRVTKTEKQLNGGGWKLVSEIAYDALGNVKQKKVGTDPASPGSPLEQVDYAYNIRGWLLGANRDYAKDESSTSRYFGYDLGYDKTGITPAGGSSIGNYAAAQYNGNINGTVWKSKGDGVIRRYDFTYDVVNRLMKGDFTQKESSGFTNSNVNFSVKMGDGTDPLTAYDANGNIKRMQQWGLKIGGSSLIDSMSYNYYDYTNRLKNVIDHKNDTTTRLGDFRASKLYVDAIGAKNNTAIDYTYDGNGNLIKDRNKDIGDGTNDGIVYNFLDLPQTVTVRTTGGAVKGTIEYTYDAGGTKLKKVVTEGSTVTTTLYMAGTFVNDTLQFIAHEEGRIRYKPADNSYVYDYFLRDHLGNIRMVLTEEEQLDAYPAVAFEDASTANEQLYYENANVSRDTRPGGFTYNSNSSSKAQMLKKSGQNIGAGKLWKVMSGDRIHAKVDYYIPTASPDNGGANGLDALISQLGTLLSSGGAPAALKGNGATITSALNSQGAFTTFMGQQVGSGGSAPKAYLNIIFFDEQFKFVPQNSVSVPVATMGGAGDQLSRFSGSAISAPKNGYVYVYINNESNNLVYFDNLQVSHERGRILEENHYYAFGLTMAGISSKASSKMETRFKFNDGTEFTTDLSINLYETTFRGYDPQVGRFWQIDPLAEAGESWSPYAYVQNNPILYNDPLGLDTVYSATKPNWDGDPNAYGRVWGLNTGKYTEFYMYSPFDSYGPYTNFKFVGKTENLDNVTVPNPGSGGNWWNMGLPIWTPYTQPSASQSDPPPGSFSAWAQTNEMRYGTRIEAYRAWRDDPNYHAGETWFDKFARNVNSSHIEIMLDEGSGGSLMFGGFGRAFKVASKSTTVLGKYPTYLNLAEKIGANKFNIPSNIWNKMTSSQQWAANVKFLDRAIARGDNFVLSNPVKNISEVSGAFRKELDYLIGKGYNLNSSGTQLIK